MANHKRKRPKQSRAGCLMCKANKANGNRGRYRYQPGHCGFGKLRALNGADLALREES